MATFILPLIIHLDTRINLAFPLPKDKVHFSIKTFFKPQNHKLKDFSFICFTWVIFLSYQKTWVLTFSQGVHCDLKFRASDWELGDWGSIPSQGNIIDPWIVPLIDHFQYMIISVRTNCYAETWSKINCLS